MESEDELYEFADSDSILILILILILVLVLILWLQSINPTLQASFTLHHLASALYLVHLDMVKQFDLKNVHTCQVETSDSDSVEMKNVHTCQVETFLLTV